MTIRHARSPGYDYFGLYRFRTILPAARQHPLKKSGRVTACRNEVCFDDWMKLDLAYIDKWSLWLDFKILLRTAGVVLAGSGR